MTDPGTAPAELVWYVSYGSNLCAERFHCYIRGGLALGARAANPGARDGTLPREARPTWLRGSVYFARHSKQWNGGVAFYDPEPEGRTAARAYLITLAQFADVAAQEVGGLPGDVSVDDVARLACGERLPLGARWYQALRSDDLDGRRVFTLTAPWRATDVSPTPPSAPYLRMLAAGLGETFGWTATTVVEYLSSLGGVRGKWPDEEIAALVRS